MTATKPDQVARSTAIGAVGTIAGAPASPTMRVTRNAGVGGHDTGDAAVMAL
jgi:hypothetical protein